MDALHSSSLPLQNRLIDAGGFAVDIKTAAATVLGDRPRLLQAIRNVLDNAIRFSPGNDTVTLSAVTSGGAIIVTIADQGAGMSDEDVQTATDVFRQVDGGFSRRAYGLGLGLTLAKLYVELHGGKIDIDCAPGVGTRVEIRIPLGEDGHD